MELARLQVEAGWHRRRWCPVTTTLPLDAQIDPKELALLDASTGAQVPLQAWRQADGSMGLVWLVDELDPHQMASYRLVKGERAADGGGGVVLTEAAPGELRVAVDGEHLTTYHYGPDVVRPYLYPVLAQGGVGVTRDWPMVPDAPGDSRDHPHHKGIYTAHGSVNGVDNWSEEPGHGRQVHRAFARVYSGPVAGGFTQELDWVDAAGAPNMTETRRLTFYRTPLGLRLFDYAVTLHASLGPVTLGDTKEGGLISVRVASSMDATGAPDGGRFENSVGSVLENEAWGKRASWCDYAGPTRAGRRGVCFMDHLENPRYPTYWHVRNYGLMTANCFGLHDFTGDPDRRADLVLPAGQSLGWRWRVVVHAGDAQAASLVERYQDYVHPPRVSVAEG